MWRRHGLLVSPSHNAIHTATTQVLPLVEMFCRWELGEDCSDLRALMLRFDSEVELGSHELGRSLLCMLQDDNVDFDNVPRQTYTPLRVNPFAGVTERLVAAGVAIRDLHAQVHTHTETFSTFMLDSSPVLSLPLAATMLWSSHLCTTRVGKFY